MRGRGWKRVTEALTTCCECYPTGRTDADLTVPGERTRNDAARAPTAQCGLSQSLHSTLGPASAEYLLCDSGQIVHLSVFSLATVRQ